ncbi:uncharacterized protein CTRU02_201326 [Colletotrichum truncatum]|uniref:Uncharacterized protein n=1 Tax=Colletotrichum truncatum TaxID=5467 RepID=A0ACC3ZGY9_COLTU|nr:uncharacterized protein CTRU02_08118 [Colletotrichum truncatum]KAF6790598.1 hypothetical protein CTRU02_08118 [Colletotrichum truncatum]
MPILKPTAVSSKNIRIEIVPKKTSPAINQKQTTTTTPKPIAAGVKKLTTKKTSPLSPQTAKISKQKKSKLTMTAKLMRGTTTTKNNLVSCGFMPLGVMAAPTPQAPYRLLTPPLVPSIESKVEIETKAEPTNQKKQKKPRLQAGKARTLASFTPSPTLTETREHNHYHNNNQTTTEELFESSLRSLPGFAFGLPIHLADARKTALAKAFGFGKKNGNPRADEQLQRFATEVLALCVARGTNYNYNNKARALAMGIAEEDREGYFFSEICVALDSLHKDDKMWVAGYGIAALGFTDLKVFAELLLDGRLNYQIENIYNDDIDLKTELTEVTDRWVEIISQ